MNAAKDARPASWGKTPLLLLPSRFAQREHPLHLALGRILAERLDVLPVVSRATVHDLIGVVALAGLPDTFGIKAQRQAMLM